MDPRRRRFLIDWAVVTTLLVEAVTIGLRFGARVQATEFNRTAPWLLQIHHMFWSLPVLLVAGVFWRRPALSGALLGLAIGLILSDLSHHFVVLPITTGGIGWHWP